MIKNFSNWYDSLTEPKRFITFIFLVFGSAIPFIGAAVSTTILAATLSLTLAAAQLSFFYVVAFHRAFRK